MTIEAYGTGIACPTCGSTQTGVLDSRASLGNDTIRRRRKCEADHRFTTYELIIPDCAAVIRKGAGSRSFTFEPLSDWSARMYVEFMETLPDMLRRLIG